MLTYTFIKEEDKSVFFPLLTDYYRDGEDADTPQEIINEFINNLFSMVLCGNINGQLVYSDSALIGFVLWMIDTADSDFSELPGYGTFLEIGLQKEARRKGFGAQIVAHTEELMKASGTNQFYISAYGPAASFWEKCGYVNTGRQASNELFLYVK